MYSLTWIFRGSRETLNEINVSNLNISLLMHDDCCSLSFSQRESFLVKIIQTFGLEIAKNGEDIQSVPWKTDADNALKTTPKPTSGAALE